MLKLRMKFISIPGGQKNYKNKYAKICSRRSEHTDDHWSHRGIRLKDIMYSAVHFIKKPIQMKAGHYSAYVALGQ